MVATLVLAAAPAVADHGDSGVRHRAQPASTAATIVEVQRRLQALDRRAEIASEALNTMRVHVQRSRSHLTVLEADLASKRASAAALRRDLVTAAVSHFNSSGGLSTAAAFLAARSPGQFLNSLATTAIVEHQQAALLHQLRAKASEVASAEQQARGQFERILAQRAQLARDRAELQRTIDAAHRQLSRLKERQRQRLLALRAHQTTDPANYTAASRDGGRPPTGQAVSGRAAVAVSTALAQVGKPYVYGAAGPYSFDCSGLTMYAWAAAGVSLSHSSAIQSQQGIPVSISDLRPGDLVFYYSPVSHVAMYIGNGMVVHAPHPGASVQVVPLSSMPISWARRVG